MKTLIAVITAHKRAHWRAAIRNTWFPMVPKDKADVVFFLGRGNNVAGSNEVILDCDDSYRGLPEKIRAVAAWALQHGYDYMLKCDDDVVLRPLALLRCGYEQYDFSGKLNRHPGPQNPYPVTVGFNYWLSRRSMEIVAMSELPEPLSDGTADNDDEKWVASNLYKNHIKLHDDRRYEIYMGEIEDRPVSRIYRPLRPPKICTQDTSEILSWTVFLEANSGDGIPVETKIAAFYSVFAKLQQN